MPTAPLVPELFVEEDEEEELEDEECEDEGVEAEDVAEVVTEEDVDEEDSVEEELLESEGRAHEASKAIKGKKMTAKRPETFIGDTNFCPFFERDLRT